MPVARTAPVSSTSSALVAVVETSMPSTSGMESEKLAVCCPDPLVDQVLQHLLAAGNRSRIDLPRLDASGQLGQAQLAGQDLPTQLCVPARVARLTELVQGSVLDHVGGHEKCSCEGVHAADVGVEEVVARH